MECVSFGGTGFHSLPGLSRGCRGKGPETNFEGIPLFCISTLKGCSSLHRCDRPRGFTPWQASPDAPAEAAMTEEADFYVPCAVLILYKHIRRESCSIHFGQVTILMR